jgi:steroid delta-isomerase-like uncharacterized protein
MSSELKQLAATLTEEIFNRGNYELVDEYVAAEFYNHEAPHSRGPEGFKATARWLRGVFPDYHVVVDQVVADESFLVVRLTVSGTHRGDFLGVPGTGRSFSVQHIHMYRVENGMLVEHWACRDDVGQLTQLGLMPAIGQPDK